jgi:hypothetical protein
MDNTTCIAKYYGLTGIMRSTDGINVRTVHFEFVRENLPSFLSLGPTKNKFKSTRNNTTPFLLFFHIYNQLKWRKSNHKQVASRQRKTKKRYRMHCTMQPPQTTTLNVLPQSIRNPNRENQRPFHLRRK